MRQPTRTYSSLRSQIARYARNYSVSPVKSTFENYDNGGDDEENSNDDGATNNAADDDDDNTSEVIRQPHPRPQEPPSCSLSIIIRVNSKLSIITIMILSLLEHRLRRSARTSSNQYQLECPQQDAI